MAVSTLQVVAEMDVSPLVASANTASAALDSVGESAKALSADTGYVETQNKRAAAQFDEEAAAATRAGYSMREARGAARQLAEELGVHLNRELAGTIARSELIGPLFAKAFSLFALVGFIELIGQIPDAIEKIIGKITGWDEAAKKAYEDQIKLNLEIIRQNDERARKEGEIAAIGLEGERKYAAELKNSEDALKRAAKEGYDFARSVEQAQEKIDKLKGPTDLNWLQQLGQWTEKISGAEYMRNLISGQNDKLNEQIAIQKRSSEEEQKRLELVQQERIEQEKINSERAAEATKRGIEDQSARVKAYAEYATATENFDQEIYKNRYKLGEISLSQETDLLVDSYNRQFAIETDEYNKTRALLLQKAKDGTDVTTELLALDEEQAKRRMDNAKRVIDAQTATELELRRQSESTANADIENNLKIEDSIAKLDEVKAKHEFQKADSKPEIEAGAATMIDQVTASLNREIAALEQRKDILAAQPETPARDREIAALTAQEQILQANAAAEVERIVQEKNDKLDEIEKAGAEARIGGIQDQIQAERDAYQQSTFGLQEELQRRKIDVQTYYDQAKRAAEDQYAHESAMLGQEAAIWRQLAADKVISETQLTTKLEELWRQQEQAHQAMVRQEESAAKTAITQEEETIKQLTGKIVSDFTSAFNQVIQGQKTVGQAAVQLGNQLVLAIIDHGIQQVATKYIGELIQMLAEHSAFLAKILGIQTIENAESLALDKTKQEAEVADQAGVAGAAAFASVIAALPFPINIATAPGVAAQAVAETESIGQFAAGGVVPGIVGLPVPAIVHGGERVLTTTQNATFERAINSVVTGPRTVHNMVRVNVTNNGGPIKADDVGAAVARAIRNGSLEIPI